MHFGNSVTPDVCRETERNMDFEITARPTGAALEKWQGLLMESGLIAEENIERTLLVYDGDKLVATGSRDGCVLKLIAVAESHRGEDLTAKVLTELRRDAFEAGHTHLFLYTKPENKYMFESLLFYPVVETADALVMENKKGGLQKFLDSLPETPKEGEVGAIVMNCNPFTRGHRYIILQASKLCKRLFVFVLSEDKSEFSFDDRIEMVRRGTKDLKNVKVLPTGPYLISSATFPTYFVKDRDKAKHVACDVDIEIFKRHFAKRLGIKRRFVGTEPYSPMTAAYNDRLLEKFKNTDIKIDVINRFKRNKTAVSASEVRKYIKSGNREAVAALVPKSTLEYLDEKKLIKS